MKEDDTETVHWYCWEGLAAIVGGEGVHVVTGWAGSPVHLGVVGTQLLPEDSVSTWRGQKAALSLRPTSQLHLLHLNGHLHRAESSTPEEV